MNIIFYGARATGKSVMADALADYYKKLGREVRVINDDFTVTLAQERDGIRILERTVGRTKRHTIVTTQAKRDRIYRLVPTVEHSSLYDYAYACVTPRRLRINR